MSFNLILFLILLFVIIPEMLRRYASSVFDGQLNKWPDMPTILRIFERIPQIKLNIPYMALNNTHISLFFAGLFIYFSHQMSLPILGILSLVMFAYLAHLYQDELFDTFWNSIITFFSFFVIYSLLSGIINFVLVETDWNIIWRNRRMLLVGPNFMAPATGHEIWRLWPPFYFLMAIIGAVYGTLGEKKRGFFVPYSIFAVVCLAFLWQEQDYYSPFYKETVNTRNYDPIDSTVLLLGGLALGAGCFHIVHSRFKDAEEYKIKYFQNIIVSFTVIAFIATVMILDPPGDTGVKPSGWGGLFLNLIFASAAIVVGFGLGVCLVFGRRSKLPLFWMPSVAIIELVRSGPLIAWLFFAQILVPDIINPVWEADIASRVILVLSFFFGCYLSEVLRGGLQAVPHGQYEAATALGLSPLQIKLQIELPQAIRTTLPAIVSQIIGMLKDTSLVYFFGIYDAFRVAKDLPAQPDFIGHHEQALFFVGMLFWILSFYLSRVSRRIEKNLGLAHEGGGEAT